MGRGRRKGSVEWEEGRRRKEGVEWEVFSLKSLLPFTIVH